MQFKPKLSEYLNLVLFAGTSISLIALQSNKIGIIFLVSSLVSLTFCRTDFIKNMGLIYLSIAILALTPIKTTTEFPQSFYMGIGLLFALIIPYIVTTKIYKNKIIKFPILKEKAWNKSRIIYLFLTAVVCYLLVPVMLRSTGSYDNWPVVTGFWNMTESYVGLNLVGIFDELFFVCTVLAILQRFFPFWLANMAQAILFTSFLHTLAFEGWSVFMIYIFALLQGYIFKKTKSLLFILAIHLTVDLVLHLAIIYLNRPDLFDYFLT